MATPGAALPGTVVPSGSLIAPGGAQGIPGTSGSGTGDMLKSVYDTNANNIVDAAEAVPWTGVSGKPTSFTPSPHEASHVTGGSDPIPPASSSTAGLLKQVSGNTTDFVDGTNTCQNLVTAVQPTIWYARLRSFNAVGNPTFEVDQRNVGTSITAGAGTWAQDRWQFAKNAGTTMAATGVQTDATSAPVTIPGTNFAISSKFYRVTLTASQATLGASDIIWFNQFVEGIRLRELISDVHSTQVLVRSSVAGLKFGLALRDAANTRSLTKLCTISSANTWTLISLPALPLWTAGTTWSLAPGVNGYEVSITLACGSTYTAPANDTWQTGNFVGAPGQSNLAASAVNSTFDIAFIQHEPGPLCSTPIDCPFTQNLDECLRYYTKSYDYGTLPGAITNNGMAFINVQAATNEHSLTPFKKVMAKVPTITGYSPNTGAINNVRNMSAGSDLAISGTWSIGDSSFAGFTHASPPAGLWYAGYHYTADTGW
jgi:hypothetical protein